MKAEAGSGKRVTWANMCTATAVASESDQYCWKSKSLAAPRRLSAMSENPRATDRTARTPRRMVACATVCTAGSPSRFAELAILMIRPDRAGSASMVLISSS